MDVESYNSERNRYDYLCAVCSILQAMRKTYNQRHITLRSLYFRWRRLKYPALSFGVLLSCLFVGCSTEDDYTADPKRNFRALWEILDKGYCYFDLKLPQDSTWEDLYEKHIQQVRPDMTTDELFRKMSDLIRELRDGHVNIITPFDYGRYWGWKENYPTSLNTYVRGKYLGRDYRIAGGLNYERIRYNNHEKDSVALIVYNSFSYPVSHANINAALSRLADCKGIIFDIRENGGGNVNLSDRLASHFVREKTLTSYMRHKTGPGHNDFSSPRAMYIEPVTRGVRWYRPVVLLVDRGVYSAANDFVLKMKDIPHVLVLGDTTGGGAGMPMSSELPNGWGVRYSASRTLDKNMQDVEFGISPHKRLPFSEEEAASGRDNLIEAGIEHIRQEWERLR
ncbi:S41 family peptidase [Porphyromonas crevioricanis]|uniref:C-terminal processing peptidase n=2 Tax=Porphyromonas crevioricanis TaxID=393921 RepID=A0A2X4PHK6_9PORP|nr:S41 family peptidase [Porphyromonas crevioricanis]GAD06872.1 carboxyl-terminal protease-related protein [Porphyromonas crevioricanis JCM 13913]SQH73444.1 C-terminal processing peptidase [Porphyromonas crevioricanis]